jgi:hypothetical protein
MKGRILTTATGMLLMLAIAISGSSNLTAHAGSCNPPFPDTDTTEASDKTDSKSEKTKWVNNANVRGPLLTHARNARLSVKSIKLAMKRMLAEVHFQGPDGEATTNEEREPNANETKMVHAALLSAAADLAAIEQLTKESELPSWVGANSDGSLEILGKLHPGVSAEAKQAWKDLATLSAAAQETADSAKKLGPFRPQGYRWRKDLNVLIPKLYAQVGQIEKAAITLETDQTIRQFDFESADTEEKNNP